MSLSPSSHTPGAGVRFAVVGNPGNRRTTMFADAVRAAGHAEPRVLAWLDVLPGRFAFRPGAFLRIDSPGEDAEVDRLLRNTEDPTRVEGTALWYRRFTAAVREVTDSARRAGSADGTAPAGHARHAALRRGPGTGGGRPQPNLARHLPGGLWERRHAPASFTYASHQAMFAGFLPTPATPGPHPRLFAARFEGSETTANGTFVYDTPDLVSGLAAAGYRTVCIGGVGFFNKRAPLGSVLPGMFQESHWEPEFGVPSPTSFEAQVARAEKVVAGLSQEQRLFLFVNVSALHQPNWFHLPGANREAGDSRATHAAALEYVDRRIGRLFAVARSRRPCFAVVCSDHGTAYGEDGYSGHRIRGSRLAARGAVPLSPLRPTPHRSRPTPRPGTGRGRVGRAAAAAVPPGPRPSACAGLRTGVDAHVPPHGRSLCDCHIGYVRLESLPLYDVFAGGVLERIPAQPPPFTL